jgi:hypothetical protein
MISRRMLSSRQVAAVIDLVLLPTSVLGRFTYMYMYIDMNTNIYIYICIYNEFIYVYMYMYSVYNGSSTPALAGPSPSTLALQVP